MPNVQGALPVVKNDMTVTMKMTGKDFFASLMKKGKVFDVSDGIIALLVREDRGNVHNRKAIAVTGGS
jgi:hypothetical protein